MYGSLCSLKYSGLSTLGRPSRKNVTFMSKMQCVPLTQLAASSFSDDVIAQLFPAVWSLFALWGFHEWLMLRILWRSNKGVWIGIDNLFELRQQNTHTTLVLIVRVSSWSLVTVNSFLFTVHLLYVRALVYTISQNILGNDLTKYQVLKDPYI